MPLSRVPACGLRFVIQMPWVTMLFELADDVFGDGVALRLRQPLAKAAHDFRGAAQRKGQFVTEHVAARHSP